MKKVFPLTLVLACSLEVLNLHSTAAKGPGGEGAPGRPPVTGLERARILTACAA